MKNADLTPASPLGVSAVSAPNGHWRAIGWRLQTLRRQHCPCRGLRSSRMRRWQLQMCSNYCCICCNDAHRAIEAWQTMQGRAGDAAHRLCGEQWTAASSQLSVGSLELGHETFNRWSCFPFLSVAGLLPEAKAEVDQNILKVEQVFRF